VDLFYAVLALVVAGSGYIRFLLAKRVRARPVTARSRQMWLRLMFSAATRSLAAGLFAIAAITSSSAVFVAGLVALVISIVVTVVFSFARPRR